MNHFHFHLDFLGLALHCTYWQNTSNHKCSDNEGDSLILLDSTIKSPFECEALCLRDNAGVGCCYLSTDDGCFWKANATAERTTDHNDSFAVTCTYKPPGKLTV